MLLDQKGEEVGEQWIGALYRALDPLALLLCGEVRREEEDLKVVARVDRVGELDFSVLTSEN